MNRKRGFPAEALGLAAVLTALKQNKEGANLQHLCRSQSPLWLFCLELWGGSPGAKDYLNDGYKAAGMTGIAWVMSNVDLAGPKLRRERLIVLTSSKLRLSCPNLQKVPRGALSVQFIDMSLARCPS
ncbi:hypothetical protein H920_09523 [Fukomys damarensis]|uniref:Uncharacterized protein n=1 Tax=Fukomys damarensis TaxID=885580 RepID=A0A091DF00_FUKDA|nr:hypothetical protein H920_09523 [Fukomys damarensis]